MNADFTLLRDIELPSIRAHAREFEHGPSGAHLLHLETDDPENCFALAFSTPPDADHGVPHILEHAVLAGSDKFPVREPFFEMVKSSPAGFINAMTSDMWTVYPICTTLEGDFWNLAEVYADAVFHPLLTLDTFEREGHHLKLENAGDITSNLERSGIVYNEMKGAFSSPESLVYRSGRNLFPGGALGFESGGDPQSIPELTWEKLRDFHMRYYAPGNCLLVLYGNIPLEKQLDFWGQKLANIERRPSLAARPSVQKFDAPRFIEEPYAIEPDGDATNATFLSLRWRCGDALDPMQMMSFEVLQRLLAGHDGAPLKKALIASKLGADVFAINAEENESEQTFHVALKGSERDRAREFEALTLRVLEDVASTGFSPEEIETALRQIAYATLEIHSLYPLHLAMDMARYATSGGEPLNATRGREVLEEVGRRAREDADYFPRLIREYLVENPHRLLMVIYPDPEHGERLKQREREGLAAIKATLSDDALRSIDERAQALEEAQSVPNSPEALASLPVLARRDLPNAPLEIPTSVESVAGMTVLKNDVFSNGVAYLHAAVDIRDLPPHLWKFLPRFCDAWKKLGAAGQSWEQIAARRAASTGGISCHPTAVLHAQSGASLTDMRFSLKTLDGDVDAALDVFGDLMFSLESDDRPRLHEVQTQGVASYRNRLISDALGVARVCSARSHSPVGWLHYLWNSPLTFAWMSELTDNFTTYADDLIEGINEVRDFLLNRARWTWSFTGSDAAFARVQSRLSEWGTLLADRPLGDSAPVRGQGEWDGANDLPTLLGLAAPLDVQFCARAFPIPSRESTPLVDLGLRLLHFDYFLPEIRFKGNAYGGGQSLDSAHGALSFYSYRDPHLTETLRVFDGATAWAASQKWTDADLERALLGNVKDAVPAIRPAQATGEALTRYRRGETPELRATKYRQKLEATPEQVHTALLAYLEEVTPKGATAVAASRVALENANTELEAAGQPPLQIEEMLPPASTNKES
ncbi:hypothetical protein IAD21_02135 [Abditibacteriota bacterium]|nr:hypothetical protein IAD21_02135 [Abditibacteriota bacterium]